MCVTQDLSFFAFFVFFFFVFVVLAVLVVLLLALLLLQTYRCALIDLFLVLELTLNAPAAPLVNSEEKVR